MSAQDYSRELMETIAEAIDQFLNENRQEPLGFAILVFEFGESGEIAYVGNADREDMIKTFRDAANQLENNPGPFEQTH